MIARENLINKYAVLVDGECTFTTVHNDYTDALKEAKRLAKKEMRVAYLVNILATVTPRVSLEVEERAGGTIEEA